ncbi:MAG: hypothetical protein D3925_01505 [Candidatus Electrothrix sp. AR5]|nr:hypothetical protein [Candidatus Electrothrix sp. AR5]
MEWQILITEEYEEWFGQLPQKHKAAIATDLEVLRHFGPQLGRPHVDQIKGSRYSNMKELRTKASSKVYRSLFAFDPDRQAVILCGGDKKGKNQEKFYKRLIAEADRIFADHLENMQSK